MSVNSSIKKPTSCTNFLSLVVEQDRMKKKNKIVCALRSFGTAWKEPKNGGSEKYLLQPINIIIQDEENVKAKWNNSVSIVLEFRP